MADSNHSDDQVLADPGSHTVEQVTAVFARRPDDDVETAKQLEADGQGRKGIVDWERPAAKVTASEDDTFSRERLLGDDGVVITGQPVWVIAGALHDVDQEQFTRKDITSLVDKFLKREVPTEAAA